MILTGLEIEKQVKAGNIIISPFNAQQINPNSYNYRLGTSYKKRVYKKDGCLRYSKLFKISQNGLLLVPNTLYLSTTEETIGSEKYVTSLIGRSSVGRLGLFVQISADLGNLGSAHKWTLELTCVQPLIIYPNMIIGQVSFWKPEGVINNYAGEYHKSNEPQESLYIFKDTIYDLNG